LAWRSTSVRDSWKMMADATPVRMGEKNQDSTMMSTPLYGGNGSLALLAVVQ
jgi:hypothetical protein